MNTCLYEGSVWHRRNTPVAHAFRCRLSMLYIDLDELDDAFSGRWPWTVDRAGLVSFQRRDHFGDPRMPLIQAVRELLAARGYEGARGPVRLLTQPRYLGFAMNPVSFYFCYDSHGEQLEALVVEVTNTPWGEQHCYVFPGATIDGPNNKYRVSKELHVSPFMPMDIEYRCRSSLPGDDLAIRVENYREQRRIFHAEMQMVRRTWTSANLRRSLLRYPLTTQRIAAGIYWQALRLWWKGCPAFSHPRQRPSVVNPNPVKAA